MLVAFAAPLLRRHRGAGPEDVDDLAVLVGRPVQIRPASGELHAGLVDDHRSLVACRAGRGASMNSWREGLHPAVDGDVIDIDATLGQKLLHGADDVELELITAPRRRPPSSALER